MIKLVDLLSEFPKKIDHSRTIPELMKRVLSMPTLSSKEMLSVTSKINEEGMYFWYLTPDGAKRWEKVLSLATGKPQTLAYCKTNDEGNYLVYVGIAGKTDPKRKSGLNGRLYNHIGAGGGPRESSLRAKIFTVLFNDMNIWDDFIFQSNQKDGGGQYFTEYRGQYDDFIAENFKFNFIRAADIDLDKDLPIKKAIEAIEEEFINSCVLHFNDNFVPDEFKPLTVTKINPSKYSKKDRIRYNKT
tara:strand:+ start:19 stop:750 length:732 start_codon:yes stop_codon:yes gene_type:complete